MPKVWLQSLPDGPDEGFGGIHRVLLNQRQYLPRYGWEVVDDPTAADVIACHVEIPQAFLRLYPDKAFVVHNHGLYWTDGYQWERWEYITNQNALAAIRVADAITAVSHWTGQALRRNSMRPVDVVHHSVDAGEWATDGSHDGYVLWNKTRVDPICDPTPVMEAARLLERVPFVTTFGTEGGNIRVTGKMAYEESKAVVQRAGVYLATTRETFGIGTLEAMAAGVPVVGYDWGGNSEIVTHGHDGWLVRPGDVEGLAEGIQWALANRQTISAKAVETARRFSPEKPAAQYAEVYQRALDASRRRAGGPRVSVIVPAYRMGDYLDQCLASVYAQSEANWECIIVNDASPDPRDHEIAQRYCNLDSRFREIIHTENAYLAAARNTGIDAARGRYIFPLDADDQIARGTLAVLADALDGDRTLHIAYGNVWFVGEDGRTPVSYRGAERYGAGRSGWPIPFRLDQMLTVPGQPLPYASMFRREVWEQTGGYRVRSRSSEDCDFWLRATSYGYRAAMVTEADTLVYRDRPGSMSKSEGWEEHRPWFPWVADRNLIPAAAVQDGKAFDAMPMPSLDPVVIAVVIPVGPGHGQYVIDAVDSVDAQTFRNWECIVVNDSGEELPRLPSWVRVVDSEGHREGGVAAARNTGIRASRAPLFLPLDADDLLADARSLQAFLDEYTANGPAVIYSDFWEDPKERGHYTWWRNPDYDPRRLLAMPLHAVTALTPRRWWEEVGGYDPEMPWEDWEFSLALAARGYCSRRIEAPLLLYRKHTGMRRNANFADKAESEATIMRKGYWNGDDLMACTSCGSGRSTTASGFASPRALGAPRESGDWVLVRYIGPKANAGAFRSRVDPRSEPYRFGMHNPEQWVRAEDAPAFLSQRNLFVLIEQKADTVATEAPVLAPAREPVMAGAVPSPAGTGTFVQPDSPFANVPLETAAPEPEPVQEPVAAEAAPEPTPEPGSMQSTVEASEGAKALAARHNREELNRMAVDVGIQNPESLGTKEALAQVILVKREMRGG